MPEPSPLVTAGPRGAGPEPAPEATRVGAEILVTAFPEALERVKPAFFMRKAGDKQPLLRWVTGLPLAIAYTLDGAEGPSLIGTKALRGLGATRSELHERALTNLRATLPPGFAPGDEPAFLDGGAAAILLLPELVPPAAAWIAFPAEDGSLVVMRDGAASTEPELRRLAGERGEDALFDKPVRVRSSGFAPHAWPDGSTDRRTDPGFSAPDDSEPRGGGER